MIQENAKVAHFNRSPRLPSDMRKSGVWDGNGADLIPAQLAV
jgi:hypothetical protein